MDCLTMVHEVDSDRTNTQLVHMELQGLRRTVRGKKRTAYSGCFYCGVPQNFCRRWRAKSDDEGSFEFVKGEKCSYGGVLFFVLSVAMVSGKMEEFRVRARDVVRRLGVWVRDDIHVEDLAVTGVRWGDIQTIGGCVLFWVIIDGWV
jgi:hypothetical protein